MRSGVRNVEFYLTFQPLRGTPGTCRGAGLPPALEPVYYEVDKPCEVFVGERVAGRLRAMDVHQGGLRCFLGAVFGVACGRRLAGCTDEQALQRGWHDVGDAGFLAVDRDDLVGASGAVLSREPPYPVYMYIVRFAFPAI